MVASVRVGELSSNWGSAVPVVFVHGVPETSAVWDAVRSRIEVESIALSLPGFGTPRPEGFGATKDEYVEWLAAELARLDGPIDLVAHDWGAIIAFRLLTAKFDNRIRSWVVDVLGNCHPDYIWHRLAQIWQAPQVGEEWMADVQAEPGKQVAWLTSAGVPDPIAEAMVAAWDETMGRSILDLYRSAQPNPYADWGGDVTGAVPTPGLVIEVRGELDNYRAMSRQMADRLGAKVELFDGLGHWWMVQDPAESAASLKQFWASVPSPGTA